MWHVSEYLVVMESCVACSLGVWLLTALSLYMAICAWVCLYHGWRCRTSAPLSKADSAQSRGSVPLEQPGIVVTKGAPDVELASMEHVERATVKRPVVETGVVLEPPTGAARNLAISEPPTVPTNYGAEFLASAAESGIPRDWRDSKPSVAAQHGDIPDKSKDGLRRPNHYGPRPPLISRREPPPLSDPTAFLCAAELALLEDPHPHLCKPPRVERRCHRPVVYSYGTEDEQGIELPAEISLEGAREQLKARDVPWWTYAFTPRTQRGKEGATGRRAIAALLCCFLPICFPSSFAAAGSALRAAVDAPRKLLVCAGVAPSVARRLSWSLVRSCFLWSGLLLQLLPGWSGGWSSGDVAGTSAAARISSCLWILTLLLVLSYMLEMLVCREHRFLLAAFSCGARRFLGDCFGHAGDCWHNTQGHCCGDELVYWLRERVGATHGFTESIHETVESLRDAPPVIIWNAVSFHQALVDNNLGNGNQLPSKKTNASRYFTTRVSRYARVRYPGVRWARDVTDTSALNDLTHWPFVEANVVKALVFADEESQRHYHWHLDEFVRRNERDDHCIVWTELQIPDFTERLLAPTPASSQMHRAALHLFAFYLAGALLLLVPFRGWVASNTLEPKLIIVKEIAAGNLVGEDQTLATSKA